MKKNYFKKISIMLIMTLMVSLLPTKGIAFADEGLDKEKQVIEQGSTNGEEASIIGEIEELREEYSKQFLKSDGTYEAVVYNRPIHYKDGDKWIEINNSLKEKLDKDLKELDEEEQKININNEEEGGAETGSPDSFPARDPGTLLPSLPSEPGMALPSELRRFF